MARRTAVQEPPTDDQIDAEVVTPRGVMIDLSEIVDPESYKALAPKAGVKPSDLKAEVKKRAIAVLKANSELFSPKMVAIEINRQRQLDLEQG